MGGKAGLLGALAGAAAALLTWRTPVAADLAPRGAEAGIAVRLLDNGFHTDVALPRRALEARGGPLAQAVRSLGPGDWVRVGWGDAKFYVDQSPIRGRLPDGARAFLRPGNPSVVMLDPETGDPGRSAEPARVAALTVSPAAFSRMAGRIEASLALSDGAPRLAAARPGDDARFFASRETFSLVHLCNHWTAQVLAAGGVGVRPVRSALSAEVMDAARAAALDTGGRGD
ncbi:DUF2459 domain-containing protein [Brevundimonas albigilva]|uniref:DUF2459 domain-containing protein n=3 Tax=Brevundimonas TaxID=41275 RepID=A0ABY4SLA3_9CAUL|nr:DUF2459 domain-containing protein [Brevundimonas albigilva]UQV17319.1 DUF2459 domain-containing protein [Brevundimonas albigilva]URI14835.1 DUF2459 domain-containing protein [Brevundimonas albigilva]